ncbi:MAG: zinc ribbon domain-containing protein [Candidatus Omnitrophica bacterium]|jgi:putative FmdB family regulatory protein|nr:zinc ribbon domain-containing protein [Candidatus Omnitrophota bacterium]
MPTYEYECLSCAHRFEVVQKMTEAPLKSCPKCKKKLRRLIGSGSGIIFKGSGFYATDYKKSPSKAPVPETCPKSKDGCASCKHHQ